MAFLPTLCLVLHRRLIERLVSGHLLQPLALLRPLDHVSLAVDEFLQQPSMCRVLFCFQGWRDGATASQNQRKTENAYATPNGNCAQPLETRLLNKKENKNTSLLNSTQKTNVDESER